jgi:hypothetical protein
MKAPKSVTINNLGPGTLTVKVKVGLRLKARIRFALVLFRVAGWMLGKRVEIKDTANTALSGGTSDRSGGSEMD